MTKSKPISKCCKEIVWTEDEAPFCPKCKKYLFDEDIIFLEEPKQNKEDLS